MGGGASKPENSVKIQNLTEEKVVIREKNRRVLGPIRYVLEKGTETKVSRPPRHGTYLRHAVMIGNEEIGIISTDDLENKQRFTICNGAQGYEIISEERAEPSGTEDFGPVLFERRARFLQHIPSGCLPLNQPRFSGRKK